MSAKEIYDDELLKEILTFDAIHTAEKLTGNEDSELTKDLGLALHFNSVQATRQAMKATSDSHYSVSMAEYLEIVKDIGFEVVVTQSFTVSDIFGDSRPRDERWYMLYHREFGALMFATSHTSSEVVLNSSHVYYNWVPDNKNDFWPFISSGGFVKPENPNDECTIWCGDHDGREAIRFKMRRLAKNGIFLTKWAEQPWMWFLTYQDERDCKCEDLNQQSENYKRINAERMALLPKDILELISVPSRYDEIV